MFYMKFTRKFESYKQTNDKLPQGIDLKVNFPSASDTAWQRAVLSPGASPKPWGQSTSKTSSEYKYI